MNLIKSSILILVLLLCQGQIGRSDDEYKTLKEIKSTTTENEIENPRTKQTPKRKASENKRPWQTNSLLDMEAIAWPDFGGRDYPSADFTKPSINDVDARESAYSGGCAFYQPNIITGLACDSPSYNVVMGIVRGVVVDIAVDGPTKGWKSSEGGRVITVFPFDNASYGAEITVAANTRSLEGTGDVDGFCETTVQILCEGELNCVGAEPTIESTDDEIPSGGVELLWVDSGGLAQPPYTWSTSSLGYSLSKSETDNDLETTTLSVVGGVCGVNFDVYATVNVVDACGKTDSIEIRNLAGAWSAYATVCGPTGNQDDSRVMTIGATKYKGWADTQISIPASNCTGGEANNFGYGTGSFCMDYNDQMFNSEDPLGWPGISCHVTGSCVANSAGNYTRWPTSCAEPTLRGFAINKVEVSTWGCP